MITLSEREEKLIEELRKVPFGQVVIFMADGQPLKIETIKEGTRL